MTSVALSSNAAWMGLTGGRIVSAELPDKRKHPHSHDCNSEASKLMMHRLNSVVGWVALVVALGGTALAATRLPTRSVGTRQLRSHAVTRAKVAAGAIDTSRLSPKVVAAIAAQPTIKTVVSDGGIGPGDCGVGQDCSTPAGTQAFYSAPCPAGTTLLSGGYNALSDHTEVVTSEPNRAGTEWDVTLQLTADAQQPPTALVNVLCAKLGS